MDMRTSKIILGELSL